jgi:uncharacterized protein involved in exopolysaccharide biosynthesis/Mrp family chromosome partitioning ATPase
LNLPAIYEPRASIPQVIAEADGHAASQDDQITVRFLLAMLRRRREVWLLTLAICVGLALVWTGALPRIYRASADVVLITRPTEVAPGDTQDARESPTRAEDVETQVELVRSRDMAGGVLDQAGLLRDAAFRRAVIAPPSASGSILATLGMHGSGGDEPVDAAVLRAKAVAYLVDHLTVARVGASFNLRIAFDDTDPARAARIANAYARLFASDDARQRARVNAMASRVLEPRVQSLAEAATRALGAVQSYRVEHGLLSSAATGLTEQEISTYNQQIAAARAEAARDSAAFAGARAQLRAGGADNVGEAAGSPVVSALRGQRAQLVVRERELSQRYFDNNPDLVTARRQIADIDSQIAAEVNRSLRNLEAQSQASTQRLASLETSRNGTRVRLGADNQALVELSALEQRANAAQALYDSYLQRRIAASARSGTEQPTARLISAATVPVFPASPDLALNLALGAVIGVLLGATLAIAVELSYRGLTTVDDVEERLGLAGLGFVPACRTVDPHARTPIETLRDYPDGGFAEALRNVVVSIQQGTSGRPGTSGQGRVVAVTSAVPGEGKSTITACIGQALASAGDRVLVIDCDVIRAQLSRQLGFTADHDGLREALHSETGAAVPYEIANSGLRVLPITRRFAKGERLTERGRLQRMLARLRDENDLILLDCPPILPIAETREIVALADGIVLVARWRKTHDRVIKAAVRQLPARAIMHLGVVLNLVDMKKQVRFGGNDAASFYEKYRGYYA